MSGVIISKLLKAAIKHTGGPKATAKKGATSDLDTAKAANKKLTGTRLKREADRARSGEIGTNKAITNRNKIMKKSSLKTGQLNKQGK